MSRPCARKFRRRVKRAKDAVAKLIGRNCLNWARETGLLLYLDMRDNPEIVPKEGFTLEEIQRAFQAQVRIATMNLTGVITPEGLFRL